MVEPKTEYVKKKLKLTKWKKRDYIEDLMKIEKFILEYNEKPQGMSHAMMMHNWLDPICGEFRREYAGILKEVNPKKYQKYMARKKREENDCKKGEKKYKEELKKEKAEWKKAGGKP